MKILLDESLPRKLRYDFSGEHEVFTVRDKGWLGKKNGELLRLIAYDNFELFVTVDRNLPFQQNIATIPFIIVVLCALNNRRSTLQKLIPKIFEKLSIGQFDNVVEIS
jgi:predicted nuclease of predicted toxin-antitoxin system